MTTGPSPRPALALHDVHVRYGDVHALAGASFHVAPGERVALLGPNGAGKSTAVEVVLALGTPDAGTVEVLGGPARRAVLDGRVGAMLQVGDLPTGVLVSEVLDLVRALAPDPRPLGELLDLTGIAELRDRRASQLSGGQTQRVRLAMALAGRPELLVLDEPTAAVDVEARRAFWAVIDDVAATGTAVLFTTHLLEEADRHAERVVVLSRGEVVADGAPSQVKAATGIRTIRFVAERPDPSRLAALPGVVDVGIVGREVTLHADDADLALARLFLDGFAPRDVEVVGAGLEEALIALTSPARPAATEGAAR